MSEYSEKFNERLKNLDGSSKKKNSSGSIGDILPNKNAWKECLNYTEKLGISDEEKRLELALMLYTSRYHKDISNDISRIKNNVIFFFWATFGIWIVLFLWVFGIGLFSSIL